MKKVKVRFVLRLLIVLFYSVRDAGMPRKSNIADRKHSFRPNDDDSQRYEFVDALRLVAASSVLIQHIFEKSRYHILNSITNLSPGVFGVVLFFLVSGLVMPISVKGGLDIANFSIRRVFRIYPALIAAFILWAIVQVVARDPRSAFWHATLSDWLANLLLINDFFGRPAFLGVTWTLILEFAWYALFAFGWRKFGSRSGSVLTSTAALASAGSIILSLAVGHRMPMGRIGMIYAATIGFQSFRWLSREIRTSTFVRDVFVFLSIMAVGNAVAFGHFHHPTITFAQSFWPWLFAPALFLTILHPALRTTRIFENKGVARFGAISLSIYLLHPIAMAICLRIAPEFVNIVATLGLTIAMAWASFRWIEQPGIAFGRRVGARLQSRSAEEALALERSRVQ
ncbi:acyltransferase [Sphingomonas sp. BIUV-7]|uniref:Acyltransferase n=1 Tax=Sphingomonas natans TaxID=3063330 RepID=A0ABT8YER4_9SPHN|nr:acyltransferase [Sphingomonas sp. BIUV-7]MDO6416159.1 acyltransferase [Sphingomonas sp. BIUV-7]